MEWQAHCTKLEDHGQFIPIKDFSEKNLATDDAAPYDTSEVYDLVRLMADVTVRLRIRHVSLSRSRDDPFYKHRGSKTLRTASGWVSSIEEARGPDRCSCRECVSSPEAYSGRSFIIQIQTACHVIYDDAEAKSALVDLFYDADNMKEEIGLRGKRHCQLEGVALIRSDMDLDVSILKCVTHEDEVYHRLQSALALIDRHRANRAKLFRSNRRKLWNQVQVEPSGVFQYGGLLAPCQPTPARVVIVSHPHGLPKRITVGSLNGNSFRERAEGAIVTRLLDVIKEKVTAAKASQCQDESIKYSLVRLLSNFLREFEAPSEHTKACNRSKTFDEDERELADRSETLRLKQMLQALDSPASCSSLFVLSLTSLLNDLYKGIHQRKNSADIDFINTESWDKAKNYSYYHSHLYFNEGYQKNLDCISNKLKSLLSAQKFEVSNEALGARVLWKPEYNAATCPGSSGAPVLILPESPMVFRYKEGDRPRSRSRSPPSEMFHTHCSWRKGCHLCPPKGDKWSSFCGFVATGRRSSKYCCFHDRRRFHKRWRQRQKKKVWSLDDCARHLTQMGLQCQQNSEPESDMTGILVFVIFPSGKTMYCEIFFYLRKVKEEKVRLLELADEDHCLAENYSLLLETPANPESGILLNDDEEILTYSEKMACDAKLIFVPKEEQVPSSGPPLGVSLKL